MTSTTTGQLVLKQDTRRRVQYSKEHRKKLLEEFDRSGMSGASFARLSGIRYTTFAGWIKWRKRQANREALASGAEQRGGPIRLLEALVEAGGSKPDRGEPGLRVELPGGSRILIESPVQMQMAAELVALIASRCQSRC
jgi:hypothetical protein